MARKTAAEKLTETRLDEDTTRPSTTAPGDGPADTTDPDERAVSAPTGELSEEALAAGTHNAVTPAPPAPPAPSAAEDEDEERVEEYTVARPNGTLARVRHNIDTGDTEVLGDAE